MSGNKYLVKFPSVETEMALSDEAQKCWEPIRGCLERLRYYQNCLCQEALLFGVLFVALFIPFFASLDTNLKWWGILGGVGILAVGIALYIVLNWVYRRQAQAQLREIVPDNSEMLEAFRTVHPSDHELLCWTLKTPKGQNERFEL